jgi:hypothetical protein
MAHLERPPSGGFFFRLDRLEEGLLAEVKFGKHGPRGATTR